MDLASRYPTLAIDNAENYEYFAENTPPLSMGAGGEISSCSNQAKLWVHKAYIGYYARCAEFGGYYWCTRLDAEGRDLSAIIAVFGTSQEYANRFRGLSDGELINNLYRNMFDGVVPTPETAAPSAHCIEGTEESLGREGGQGRNAGNGGGQYQTLVPDHLFPPYHLVERGPEHHGSAQTKDYCGHWCLV